MILNNHIYNQQLNTLHNHFQIITFNQHNHNKNKILNINNPISKNFKPNITALLHKLNLNNIVLINHSLNNITTQQFLYDFPKKHDTHVINTILLSTTPTTTTSLITQQIPRNSQFNFNINKKNQARDTKYHQNYQYKHIHTIHKQQHNPSQYTYHI